MAAKRRKEPRRANGGGGGNRGEHEARDNRHAAEATSGADGGKLAQLGESDLVLKVERDETALVLVLDGVQDPHNLGACLRTAAAAGCIAVVAPKDRACPLTDTAVRVACGGAADVPYVRVTNLARFLRAIQEAGAWVVGTSDAAEQTIHEIDLKGRIAMVMGAEGEGMRRLTEEHCDFLSLIPMPGRGSVDCLNVSVATGVCLFEAVRQRCGD